MALNSSDDAIDNNVISSETELIEIEEDLIELSELVKTNPNLLGGEDVAQLLERLSNAENMAEGMESKLDNVLQNLDKLLAILDSAGPQSESTEDRDSAQAAQSRDNPKTQS